MPLRFLTTGASVHDPPPVNAPVAGAEPKLTAPVGALWPLAAVSVTVAVHVDALPGGHVPTGRSSRWCSVVSGTDFHSSSPTSRRWPRRTACR